MLEIKGITLRDLQQEESFEFHSSIYRVLESEKTSAAGGVIKDYDAKIQGFDLALKQIRESAKTTEITAADERNDRAWRGLHNANKICLNHFDPAIAKAAHAIDVIIRGFGDPTALSYPNEVGTIRNLCQQLSDASTMPLIKKAGLEGWLNELRSANDAFSILFDERATEQSSLVTGLAKQARQEVEDAYRNMVKVINATLIVAPWPSLEEKIDKVNYYVDYYKNIIAKRKGVAAAKKEDE